MNFHNVEFFTSFGVKTQFPESEKPEIVFCGRSNVGKSSLLNKLCFRKSIARVSATPGKTTTVNFFTLDKDWFLVDLPGYGYAKRSESEKKRWSELMEHYFNSARDIRLVCLLIDSRHEPSADDFIMLDFLNKVGFSFLVVLTKVDKLSKSQLCATIEKRSDEIKGYAPVGIVPFSAETLEYAENLRCFISKNCTK
ncbi:MAG: ribosome biogenesis GTP-binding protein YihA/YsxC [Oscillospiraceae bacterium]